MRRILFVLSTIALFAFTSCSKIEGEIMTKDFGTPEAYTALQVSNAFDVYVDETANTITVTAGENVMPFVRVENQNNTLKIYLKTMSIFNVSELKVVLPYNVDLCEVSLSGATSFHSETPLKGRKAEVNLSGASDFYCDIDATEVEISMSGASELFGDLIGNGIDMELSGDSEFHGNMSANDIDINLSGSSDIESTVAASDLDLELSGASDASLNGQVTTLSIELQGASNLLSTMVDNRYSFACLNCQGSMSGASSAYLHGDGEFFINLSGASDLHYTGTANTSGCTVSGGSEIHHDGL